MSDITRGGGDRRRVGARLFAALFLGLSLAAAVQAHLDLRAQSAQRYLAQAEAASAEDDRRAAQAAAASEVNEWTGTGELRDLAAQLALLEPDASAADAAQWAQEALKRAPANGETWTRLAFALTERDGAVTEEAASALGTSFVVMPYGSPRLQRARLEFVLAHWDEVATTDRRNALRQVAALTVDPDDRAWLESLPASVSDEDARSELESLIALYLPQ